MKRRIISIRIDSGNMFFDNKISTESLYDVFQHDKSTAKNC